jgi:hypothetical protein
MNRGRRHPSRILNVKVGKKIFPINKEHFFDGSHLFESGISFVSLKEYELKSQVPPTVFKEFVDFLEGGRITVSKKNYSFLRLLAEEFGFGALTIECDLFQASCEPFSPSNPESVYKEVFVNPGHRVTITVEGRSVTYEVLRSLREIERFLRMLYMAKAKDIRIEEIDDCDRLIERVVAAVVSNTIAYFSDDHSKRPFLAMVLWKLQTGLFGLSVDSAIYCLNRLKALAPTGFNKARLLLLSQCDPACPSDYVPLPNADSGIVITAIGMIKKERNGRWEDAYEFLQQLKASGRYEYELGTDWEW